VSCHLTCRTTWLPANATLFSHTHFLPHTTHHRQSINQSCAYRWLRRYLEENGVLKRRLLWSSGGRCEHRSEGCYRRRWHRGGLWRRSFRQGWSMLARDVAKVSERPDRVLHSEISVGINHQLGHIKLPQRFVVVRAHTGNVLGTHLPRPSRSVRWL